MEKVDCKCEVIKNFNPAWFASVMGTGILANASALYSYYLPPLMEVSLALFYFNLTLFFVLLIPWTLRWISFKEDAMRDLENPIVSNFYPTIAIAMLVLSSNFIIIGKALWMGKLFWFTGALLTIFFGVLVPYIVFKGEHAKIDHINPAWFIPPVGLIVIPVAGASMISQFDGALKEIVLFLNYFGWGAGFFLYIALLAICIYRFALHTPLPNVLAPTIWINLGPIGVGVISLVNLVKNSPFITLKEPYFVFALLLWGFGIWWVIIAILMTLHYIKVLRLPFAMSWWAFTFPLGAYVVSSHILSEIFKMALLDYIGFGLYWLLFFLWSVTLLNTIVKSYRGNLSGR